MTTALILDTDIGSDIDDAVCLAYLLKQRQCELLGVTTVTGDTVQRASLAAAVCEAGGRGEVPIYPGLRGPLVPEVGPGQEQVPQYEAIAGRPHRKDFPRHEAIDFIRRTVRSRPGEVTLLAIGPLTNVAALFAVDPEIPGLLKQLVLMCGVFTAGAGHGPGEREWNALSDPTATAVVFRTPVPNFTSVGLEVTMKCRMSPQECRQRFAKAGGALSIVAEMAEIWFRGRPEIVFHDPLAGAVIFQPELCRYQTGRVRVELGSPMLSGLTWFYPPAEKKMHRIAVDVDSRAFFAHYFEIVGG